MSQPDATCGGNAIRRSIRQTIGAAPPSDEEPVRAVLITNILPPYRMPVLAALSRMSGLHLEVWLMAESEANRHWPFERGRIDVRVFRDWGLDFSDSDGPIVHFNPGMLISLLRRKPDVAIVSGYAPITTLAAVFFLGIARVPILFWMESTRLEEGPLRRLVQPFLRAIIRMGSGVVVPGVAAHAYVRSLGVEGERVFIAPNSVDNQVFAGYGLAEGDLKTEEALAGGSKPTCLYVGRLSPDKGVLDLVSAFRLVLAEHPAASLLLVGDGPLHHRLANLTKSDPVLKGHVFLVGHQSYADLPRYYAVADLLVFPTHHDVWGMVLNEAMCSGLPVVTTNRAGAAADLVEDGLTGWVCEAGSPTALASVVSRVLCDEGMRREVAGRAQKRVLTEFTPALQASGVMQGILSVTHHRGTRVPKSEQQA